MSDLLPTIIILALFATLGYSIPKDPEMAPRGALLGFGIASLIAYAVLA
jgi:hypothetical protein